MTRSEHTSTDNATSDRLVEVESVDDARAEAVEIVEPEAVEEPQAVEEPVAVEPVDAEIQFGAVRVEDVVAPPKPPVAAPSSGAPPSEPPVQKPPVRVVAAEAVVESLTVVDERSIPTKMWRGGCSALEWLFGVASLIVGLAGLAAIPVVQLLSLGYLLEVSGRISRTGKLRNGFIGVRQAARVGSLVLGTWLMLLPLRFLANLRDAAVLIDADSGQAFALQIALIACTVMMVCHILLAWYCGGRLRHFFWPLLAPMFLSMWGLRLVISSAALRPIVGPLVGTLSPRLLKDLTNVPQLTEWFPPAILVASFARGRMYRESRDSVWDFVVSLNLPYYFWLGARGFAGAIAWLFVPILMMIATTNLSLDNPQASQGLGGLIGFLGTMLFAIVMLYLPFMQAHFAAENRFVAMFELGAVRGMFRRAPIAFWFALLITLLFALPLYLLKIELLPEETVGLASLVFVVFIWPARILTGWAVARARKRERPRFFGFRWMSRLAALPVVGIYAFIVFFTPYLSWYGSFSLFEQHAFLTPVPFLGM